MEAKFYYAGLLSASHGVVLVAWEDNLALHALLISMKVKWTSSDVVRIGNVDVEIRRSQAPRVRLLFRSHRRYPRTSYHCARSPAQSTPWAEGTGGFFISQGGNTERLLLVTARHVVFTLDKSENKHKHFERKNDTQRRYNVTLFSDAAFNKYLGSIQAEIGGKALTAQYQEGRIRVIEGKDDLAVNKEHQKTQVELDEAKVFSCSITSYGIAQHLLPGRFLSLGDLGEPRSGPCHHLSSHQRRRRQQQQQQQQQRGALFRMRRCVTRLHSTRTTTRCLMVIKRGNTTGLTVGRANDICSHACNYYDCDKAETSKEWAIFTFDSRSGAFSAKGDSGSVIVDGLLTGGAGATPSSDVTYATPISFLKRMHDKGLCKPNVNPVLTALTHSPD
ncbi:hypothetical protein F5888DRAFT_1631617 [Russula emetica]|nr:hypothetical protein F5888DRAFT_1631617 [Russula emetica]